MNYSLSVRPVIFAHHDVSPSWGLEADPGCGGPSQVRLLKVVLDTGLFTDEGLTQGGPDNPNARAEPFGTSFTVSSREAADIQVDVFACSGLYEFGVKIEYVSAGQTRTMTIGAPENPLRIIGGWRGVERFYSQYGSPVSRNRAAEFPRGVPSVPTNANGVCR
ncbi:hypothetical protein AB0H43_12660 [Hamadaea sp. NPDC050747]|uniref:hypothetical protein n=1 Tax=Hamadaea sp. NPDC050747 TaxID=3155789 RepID=UPI0033E775B2